MCAIAGERFAHDGRRAHRLEPDPDTAPVVAWMFARRLAGHSVARITRTLNDAAMFQGLLLPAVVRWSRLPSDTSVEQERHLAEILATEEALAALPQLAAGLGTDTEVADRLHGEYEKHLRVVRASSTGDAPPIRR
jgi:hypothetical protein